MACTDVLFVILLAVSVIQAATVRQKINDKAACSEPEGLAVGIRTKLIDGSVFTKRKSWRYKHGAILVVTCDCGYEPISFAPKQTWVCQGSIWIKSGQVKCRPKNTTTARCPPLESIEHGLFEVDWSAQRVEYSCEAGARLRGDAQRTCEAGIWNGTAPVCDHLRCGNPPQVKNAKIFNDGTFYAGDRAKYSCINDNVPSRDGPFEATCDENGQWNPTSVKCRSSQCVVPELPENVNATYWYSQYIKYYFIVKPGDLVPNRAIMLSRCATFDYQHFSGDSYRECNLGRWSGEEPNCTFVYIEDETHPQASFFAYPDSASTYSEQGEMIVKEGAKINFFCSSRFEMAWRGVFGNIFRTPGAKITDNQPVPSSPGMFENSIEIAKADGHHTNVYTCYRQDQPEYFAEFRVKVIP